MKTLLIATTLFSSLLFAGCKKDAASIKPSDDMVSPQAVKTYLGNFVNGPYGNVRGTANIFRNTDGTLQLQLQDLASSNGPDLKVYLSKELQPVNFINLGDLKSTNGNQVYTIQGTPDFDAYKFVLIHCKSFNHMFGSAELKKN